MNYIDVLFFSVALAMDCFAVSIAAGMSLPSLSLNKTIKMPISFGLFQGLMPIASFALSFSFAQYIVPYLHWISFIILMSLGIKAIYESYKEDSVMAGMDYFSWRCVIVLALATSIDAFVTGILFLDAKVIFILAMIIIALGSFFFSCLGLYIGHRYGRTLNLKVEVVGGVILMVIGIKLLVEHYL